MNQILLCPDGQSPELQQPCPTSPVNPTQGEAVGALAYTGADIAILLLCAVVIILVGYYLIQRMREDENHVG